MSASTVSITANPASATRRRPVVVGDKKTTGIELVAVDGDKHSTDKDLSHSIRGDIAVLEREISREAIHVKKPLPGFAAAVLPPRRTKKSGSKPEKPRWQTIISVFTKNLILLVALLGLVQMIRKLATIKDQTSSPISSDSSARVSELDRRIGKMEKTLTTTTQAMQVQVDVVDRRIEREIGGLRAELSEKIESKSTELGNELKNLEVRTESLGLSVAELRAKELVSKEDLEILFDEFKKGKGLDNGYGDLDLGEIRVFAREIVEKEVEKYAADGLSRVDYALASGGAMVVKHSAPYANMWFYLTQFKYVHPDAEKMLRPSFGEPGQCFSLRGSSGFVQIKLRTAIVPEAVTLEHVAKSVAYDRSSAPKDCRVSGWLHGQIPTYQVVDTKKMFLLTEFTYDLEKSNTQTFNVLDSAGSGIVDTVRFDFTSNHGNPSHTCIYRLRVHGRVPNSVSLLAAES